MRAFFFILSSIVMFAVSAVAAPPPAEFGKLPKIADAAISPDGTRLAAYVNSNGKYGIGVFYIDNTDRKPFAIGMGDGVKPIWIRWANNETVLASVWQSEKYGTTPITSGYLYTIDVNSQKGSVLIEPEGATGIGSRSAKERIFRQFNNDVIAFLPNDPDHILMSFSDIKVTAPDVQKVNVRTGKYSRMRRGTENIQDWYSDLTGEVRVGQGRRENSSSDWYMTIKSADSDKWQSASNYPGLEANEDIYGFTSNPNEMIVSRYAGKDTRGLHVYDLSQKRITRTLFQNDDYDVGGLVYSADGSEILGVSFVSDGDEVELLGAQETELDALRQKYPGYAVDYIDSNKDYSRVVVKLSSPSDAGGIFVYEPATQNLRQLSPQYEAIPNTDLGSVLSVRYTARDGQKIPAFVTLPPSVTEAPEGLPFIILPHGGPFARDSKRFDYLAQFFATRGFGVLQMNYRGSVGYGKKFSDAGRDDWVVMQEDVEDGTRWLIEKEYADPSRTCIAGWSYGGYAALIGKIKNPDLYACTISIAGVTDLKDLINDVKKYRFGNVTAKGILRGFDSKDDVKENSPVKRADEMTGPVFLAHGTLDDRVHFDQYKRMKSALKKSSAKVTALEFKDEDHYMSNQANRVEMLEALDKFLEQSVGKSEYMAD